MNHCVPDWNFEGDLHVTNQKKPIGPDHELVELLWRNGQVVLNSQTHRKQGHHDVARQDQASLSIGSYGNSSHLIQDDETVPWIHNPFEDCFGKEFCSTLFTDLPSLEPIPADKAPPTKQFEEDKFIKFSAPNPTHVVAPLQQHQHPNANHSALPELHGNPMPPPRFQLSGSAPRSNYVEGFTKIADFVKVAPEKKVDMGVSSGVLGGKGSDTMTQGKARECSAMTIGSSHCGSNQFLHDPDWSRISSSGVGTSGLSARPFKDKLQKEINPSRRGQTETFEPTLTSSSGGSGSSFGRTCRQSSGFTVHKRKGTDAEESASQSEAAELESASGNKSSRLQSGCAKRSRAAEVHNQSERRRRDRINEKMKALQELIPHCSKTDKASMLDEAIEYLKSLQLQLQVMWMGGGMGPMMFPGVQHYMSRMNMGVGSPSLASIPNTSLPRLPLINQSMPVAQTPNQAVMCQTPVMNPVNYSNPMQNASLPEQYARYLGFHHQMQTTPQPMNLNMFRFGSQAIQQSNPMALLASSIAGTFTGGAATNDALSRKTC